MNRREEVVRQLAALRFLPAGELENLCRQRSDDFVSLLDELQLRFPSHQAAIGRVWADSFNVAYVDIALTRIDQQVAGRIGYEVAARDGVLPLYEFDGIVTVAVSRLDDRIAEERVRALVEGEVSLVFAFPSQIGDAIDLVYQSQDGLSALIEQSGIRQLVGAGGVLSASQMKELAGNAYVVRFVRGLLLLALAERASDIHIEPAESALRIRFRIDGALQDRFLLDRAFMEPITCRLKLLAELDITERRLPQDGRIGFALRENTLDVRFSSVPALYGEKLVLRLLGRRSRHAIPELGQLQLSSAVMRDLRRVSLMPNGLFLVTGPTGSGKTTTLYALLKAISRPELNIVTIEDPVEYRLAGATQVQVNEAVGLSFAIALRAFLRQDPDVILVGEIRDAESGRIASQAALTGHLVLSTLHTNTALQAMTRLVDIGVEPYLVAPALVGVMAQRLVRQLCPVCREPYLAPPEERDALLTGTEGEEVRFWRAQGCASCGHSGYSGRLAVHELFMVSDEVRELIGAGASPREVRAAAYREGFRPMRYDGLKKVLRGLTTWEQVRSAVGE